MLLRHHTWQYKHASMPACLRSNHHYMQSLRQRLSTAGTYTHGLPAPSHTSSQVILPPRCLMVPALSAVKLKDSVVSIRSPPRPMVVLVRVESCAFLNTRDNKRSTCVGCGVGWGERKGE